MALITANSGIMDLNARMAAYPMVAEPRREHAIALVRPMVGCPWAGEPRVDLAAVEDGLAKLPHWFDWELGRYATALLRKREPAFAAGDLSHLRTRFEPPGTVLFVTDVRCRRSGKHPDGLKSMAIAAVVLPDHALGRGPALVPATADAALHHLPREVPRLVAPSRPLKEIPSMITNDNPPSRGQSGAAQGIGGRS